MKELTLRFIKKTTRAQTLIFLTVLCLVEKLTECRGIQPLIRFWEEHFMHEQSESS